MILTVTLNAAIDKVYVVDSYGVGSVNRVKECKYSAGGKGLNVSRVATILGEQVLATGFVGGHAGNFIIDTLNEESVPNDFVHVSAESRSCINIYDESTKEHTEFLEPGFTVSKEDLEEVLEKYEGLAAVSDVIVISGSVPRGADTTVYQHMIETARKLGKKLLLDTSGALLTDGARALPYMIKPNTDEIALLTGKELLTREELIAAAKELYRSGIEIVAISLGGDGSLVVCNEGIFKASVPLLNVINTVGCGDSMMAGFAAGLSRGYTIKETLRFASAVSAANALRPETGFIVMEDVNQILPQIIVEQIGVISETKMY